MFNKPAHFYVFQQDINLNIAHGKQINLVDIFCNKLKYLYILSKVKSIVSIFLTVKMHMSLVDMYFHRYHYKQTQLDRLDNNICLSTFNNIHCIYYRYLIHPHKIWMGMTLHKFLHIKYNWIYN